MNWQLEFECCLDKRWLVRMSEARHNLNAARRLADQRGIMVAPIAQVDQTSVRVRHGALPGQREGQGDDLNRAVGAVYQLETTQIRRQLAIKL
jgi:hypothetical protein